MKKLTALLILIILLISCANTGGGSSGSETTKPSETTAEETVDIFKDDLPANDFGGAPFRMSTFGASGKSDVQEETGDLINDAKYYRNRTVEERFNVVITEDLLDLVTESYYFLRTNTLAGENNFELYLPVDRYALMYGGEGLIYKLSDLPNIDISKPYWDQSLINCLTIGGQLFFAYGAFNLCTYNYADTLGFNKKMIDDLNLETPYDIVDRGEWTFDKFDQMARAAVRDVNGDGVMDENDVYGLVSIVNAVLPAFWIGAGVQSISKSADDIPQFTLIGDEKFDSVIQKIFAITYDSGTWYQSKHANYGTHSRQLVDGQTLFFEMRAGGIIGYRDIETEFGVIPFPKWDVKQDNYYTRVMGGNPGVVSINATDLEMISTIYEALTAESARTVIPAYYNVSLKTKFARDDESAAMLDLIFANRIYDLGDTYWCDVLRDNIFLQMFDNNNRDLASKLASIEKRINKEIDNVVKGLLGEDY